MEKVAVGPVTIDRCAGCGAIWLDKHELTRVLAAGASGVDLTSVDIGAQGPGARGRALGDVLCPRDKAPLKEMPHIEQAHVRLLWCPACHGMLLDAGELTDLSEFTLVERFRKFFGS